MISALPFWSTILVEIICVAIFSGRLLHERLFSEGGTFWKDAKHITFIVILALCVLDAIIFASTKVSLGHGK